MHCYRLIVCFLVWSSIHHHQLRAPPANHIPHPTYHCTTDEEGEELHIPPARTHVRKRQPETTNHLPPPQPQPHQPDAPSASCPRHSQGGSSPVRGTTGGPGVGAGPGAGAGARLPLDMATLAALGNQQAMLQVGWAGCVCGTHLCLDVHLCCMSSETRYSGLRACTTKMLSHLNEHDSLCVCTCDSKHTARSSRASGDRAPGCQASASRIQLHQACP